jgi:purine nucleosidase
VLNPEDIEKVLGFDNKLARFAIECNGRARRAYFEQTGEHGISLPDPVAMSIALDPSIGTTWSRHYVDVEITSELTRGMTVVDRLNVAGDERNRGVWSTLLERPPNANVCWAVDAARWKQVLFDSLRLV